LGLLPIRPILNNTGIRKPLEGLGVEYGLVSRESSQYIKSLLQFSIL